MVEVKQENYKLKQHHIDAVFFTTVLSFASGNLSFTTSVCALQPQINNPKVIISVIVNCVFIIS